MSGRCTVSIAVIGAPDVGKSTLILHALGLDSLPRSQCTRRDVSLASTVSVCLVELPIDDVEVNDDDTVAWPDTVDGHKMPLINGAITMWDVGRKGSIEDVPEVLSAIHKSRIPSLLVSSKCDLLPAQRAMDPATVERKAVGLVGTLLTARTSASDGPRSCKRALYTLLKAITSRPETAELPLRPAEPATAGCQDESDKSSDEASEPDGASMDSGQTSGVLSVTELAENGATFDELVDRLLAQPTSKTDSKFTAIFLALYRKFAAPGRLLDAVIDRFDNVERDGGAPMATTVTQLRILAIVEQWLSQYPGDFASPYSRKRVRAFVARVRQSQIFAIAAKEMSAHVEMIREDDDTGWAVTDHERAHRGRSSSLSSTASTLLENPEESLSGTTLVDEKPLEPGPPRVPPYTAGVEAAQRAAQSLVPTPKKPITKVEWRQLMDLPDDLIAQELTRMDWIMFSSIRPRDLTRYLSQSEKVRCKSLVNVTRMVDHFNHLAAWVANYILFRDKPKHRAQMVEKMMRIGRKLRELNNYNALGAIIAAIKSASVCRLSQTMELLPPQVGRDWARLEVLMSHPKSHGAYRLAWENTTGERIPYLPLHLRDLAASESNTTYRDDEQQKINWKKFEIMGEVVVGMQRAQGMPYTHLSGIKGDGTVRELVLDVIIERDEDALYQRSLVLEPFEGTGTTTEKLKSFFKR
ncbi:ras GEF [Piedraia hortae CBS 480.64]|uniref:Ras GEF n=1 Tax=Piedraia hortae CBS 480.64 TaxID=1314780 RepID=A0A6A7BWA6_9PEZI|nr:ras GEF [Piedraia hortae CBS 480.64]